VTELQCAGQINRDTVAREAAHWVQVLKDRCQCGREGRYMRMNSISSKKGRKLKKNC